MSDIIRDNFFILWLLVAIAIIFLGVSLKRRGIKLDQWEGMPESDASDVESNMRHLNENPANDHVAGNIYYNPEKQRNKNG